MREDVAGLLCDKTREPGLSPRRGPPGRQRGQSEALLTARRGDELPLKCRAPTGVEHPPIVPLRYGSPVGSFRPSVSRVVRRQDTSGRPMKIDQ